VGHDNAIRHIGGVQKHAALGLNAEFCLPKEPLEVRSRQRQMAVLAKLSPIQSQSCFIFHQHPHPLCIG
jgi:hypothetical protein